MMPLQQKQKPESSGSLKPDKKSDKSRKLAPNPTPHENFLRFLVIKKLEGDFKNDSPFFINKVITEQVGAVNSVRKIKDGLLVEVADVKQSMRLLALEKFGEHEIRVESHNALNTSKGVIHAPDLMMCSIEEIITELKSQGVTDVRRITTRRNGIIENTPSCILTFNTPDLPTVVKAGYLRLPVRMYIPSPMRCFQCQKFGHSALRCKNEATCTCGQPPHTGTPCTEDPCCVNCNGHHPAHSRKCLVYITESNIQAVRVTEKISYAEARRKVQPELTQARRISYATVTSTPPQPSTLNLQELATALIPELLRLLHQYEDNTNSQLSKPKTTNLNFHTYATNVTPTTVLRQQAKSKNQSTEINTQMSENEGNTDGILNWFRTAKPGTNPKTLKRTKTQSSCTVSPMTSANEDASIIENSSSGSNEKPPKKKQTNPRTRTKESEGHRKQCKQNQKSQTPDELSDSEMEGEEIFTYSKRKDKDTDPPKRNES